MYTRLIVTQYVPHLSIPQQYINHYLFLFRIMTNLSSLQVEVFMKNNWFCSPYSPAKRNQARLRGSSNYDKKLQLSHHWYMLHRNREDDHCCFPSPETFINTIFSSSDSLYLDVENLNRSTIVSLQTKMFMKECRFWKYHLFPTTRFRRMLGRA